MFESPSDNFKSFNETLYLIDFGMSREYISEDGMHKPLRETKSFRGNLLFSSSNA